MGISKILQRAQFLQTTFKTIAKPIKKLNELPPILRIAALAIAVIGLAAYIWVRTRSLTYVGLLLGIVLVVGGGLWLVGRVLAARSERMASAFDDELRGSEMLEDLREQWARASQELKATGVDRYNMSFYMLIGEPQSGKTTTLQKSGLNFPIGMDKIQGIGGTRNLDW